MVRKKRKNKKSEIPTKGERKYTKKHVFFGTFCFLKNSFLDCKSKFCFFIFFLKISKKNRLVKQYSTEGNSRKNLFFVQKCKKNICFGKIPEIQHAGTILILNKKGAKNSKKHMFWKNSGNLACQGRFAILNKNSKNEQKTPKNTLF